MRSRWLLKACVVWCGLLLFAGATQAEDESGDLRGSAEILYRNVSKDGSLGKYNEDFDGLDSGFRVGNVTLDWTDLDTGLADHARLSLIGLGGDPYEAGSLRIGRQDVYDLKFGYRKQDYLYSLFELVDDEDGHAWDTSRAQTDVSVTLYPHEKVDLVFGFQEVSRRGNSLFMKDIERDLFRLETPLDQISKRYTAGANLRFGSVDVVFRQTLRNDDYRFENSIEGSLGLDPTDLATLEAYDWMQRDTTSSDMTSLKLHAPLGNRVDLTVTAFGSFLGGQDLKSRVTVDASGTSYEGTCSVTTTTSCEEDADCPAGEVCIANPYAVNGGFSETDVEMDTTVVDVDLTVKITDPLRVILQYRTTQRDAEGESFRDLARDPNAGPVTVETTLDYDVDTIAGILEYQPISSLRLRGGYRTTDRALERDGFDGTLGLRDEEFDSDGDETWVVGVAWRATDWLRIFADYEDGDREMPFTAVSLVETERARFRAAITPQPAMRVDLSYTDFENRNPVFDSRSEGTSWALSFYHRANERLDYLFRYSEQDVETATPIIFDISSFNFTFPGDTEPGASFFDTDHTQGLAQVNWSWSEPWRAYLRYVMAESDGSDLFTGDASGVINDEVIDQEYMDVEAGLFYTFPGGLFVGGSFRVFDYDDENDLLDYDGEMLEFRSGLTF